MNRHVEMLELRPALASDLKDILLIDWRAFPGQYCARWSPGGLLRCYHRYPWAFRVVVTASGIVAGYSCAIYLTELGSKRMLDGCYHALEQMGNEEIVITAERNSTHLHLDMVAVRDRDDVRAAARLIRDLMTSPFVTCAKGTIRFVTAIGGTPTGNRLLRKAGLLPRCRLRRLPDGTRPILYYVDMQTAAGVAVGQRFGLVDAGVGTDALQAPLGSV